MARFQVCLLALVVVLAVIATIVEAKWKLTWKDEFKGKKVDTKKWKVQDKMRGYISELEGYMAHNVKVSKGKLILTARPENAVVDYYGTSYTVGYTSGQVTSRYLYSQKEGRWEVKAKLPSGQGFWPAIWLMPKSDSMCWPLNGEIDIMENIGNDMFASYGTYHWGTMCNNAAGYDDASMHGQSSTWVKSAVDLSMGFHQYAVEWRGNTMTWFIDGKVVKTLKEGTKSDTNDVLLKFPTNPMGFIINLAVGGDWPGPPNSATKFPSTFEIDYARIYKWVNDGKGGKGQGGKAKGGNKAGKPKGGKGGKGGNGKGKGKGKH